MHTHDYSERLKLLALDFSILKDNLARCRLVGVGVFVIITAPSGGGKSTLIRLFTDLFKSETDQPLKPLFSVSWTTRVPRADEVHDIHYHFVSRETFEQARAHDSFLEWAVVHGEYYGTPKMPIAEWLSSGHLVILDVDVVGARSIRSTRFSLPKHLYVDVMLVPESLDALSNRLVARGTDSMIKIKQRLAVATSEMACSGEFGGVIQSKTGDPVNDLEQFIDRLNQYLSLS